LLQLSPVHHHKGPIGGRDGVGHGAGAGQKQGSDGPGTGFCLSTSQGQSLKSEGRLKNTEMIVPAKAIKAESVCMETLNTKKKNYEQYMTTYKHVRVRRMNHIRKMCRALKYIKKITIYIYGRFDVCIYIYIYT
jgi:hypothetical protein